MNFEEFKKEREIWSKIETQEQLDKCRADYKKYQLSEEDKNYFEPIVEKVIDIDYIGDFYREVLYKKFNHRTVSEGEIKILIKPSFEPESYLELKLCSDKFTISFQQFEVSLWSEIYSQNDYNKIQIKKWDKITPLNFGEKLIGLFDSIFLEARKPNVGMFALDGTEYQMSKKINDKIIRIKTNPCDGSYKTTKVTRLIDAIVIKILQNESIENDDINNQINEINMYST